MTSLDHELTSSYNLVLVAQDVNQECLKGRTIVRINVKDVNDNRPVFRQDTYSTSLREDAPKGQNVIQVCDVAVDHLFVVFAQLSNHLGKFLPLLSLIFYLILKSRKLFLFQSQIMYALVIIESILNFFCLPIFPR